MKKQYLYIITLVLIVIEVITLFFAYKSLNNYKINTYNFDYNNNIFAIMIEQDDGTYKESTDKKWPTEGYWYNSEVSGCVDRYGNKLRGILNYDTSSNVASVNTTETVSCYLYFEKESKAYAIYSEDDYSLTFIRSKTIPIEGANYDDKIVTKVFYGFESINYVNYESIPWHLYTSRIDKVVFEDEIKPTSTSYWFYGFNVTSDFNVEKLNVSKVTNMSWMFSGAGRNVETLNIIGLSNWDTSNVTNMSYMFYEAGYSATTWNIGDLSNWDTSNVTDMSNMFRTAGYNATTLDIGDLSNWDTSNVTSMNSMFYQAGYSATTLDIGDLSNWDTSNVTNMSFMFSGLGYNASTWSIGDLSNWDTSKVTNMSNMFYMAGYSATTFKIDLSRWDTSNVTKMLSMFDTAGWRATTWSVGDITNWNTSNVTSMALMFNRAGYSASYKLDLSKWNVSKVTTYQLFNSGVSEKVISPNFVAS